jgi:hypothetical protein
MSMSTPVEPDAYQVFENAVIALKSILGAKLKPATWDEFDRAVHAMEAAVENGDLRVVEQKRRTIEQLDPRQRARARLDESERVEQPSRSRTASDNLTRRLDAALARRSTGDGEERRR